VSKRWWIGLAAGAMLLGAALWFLLRTLPEGVDPTWERIVATGEWRVCTDPSWPPFEFVDEETGQMVGFDLDLARLLTERLTPGLRLRLVTVGFDGLYDALLAGRCDAVLSALPYEELRVEDVSYSVAYFNAGLVLLTRWDEADIGELKDVRDRVVGVEWGFVPEGDPRQKEFLRNLELRRYDTAEAALDALRNGEVDAAIVDHITALTYLGAHDGLRLVGEPIYDVNYVIPVRPESFRLLQEINRVLLEMRRDGTLEMLQERWF